MQKEMACESASKQRPRLCRIFIINSSVVFQLSIVRAIFVIFNWNLNNIHQNDCTPHFQLHLTQSPVLLLRLWPCAHIKQTLWAGKIYRRSQMIFSSLHLAKDTICQTVRCWHLSFGTKKLGEDCAGLWNVWTRSLFSVKEHQPVEVLWLDSRRSVFHWLKLTIKTPNMISHSSVCEIRTRDGHSLQKVTYCSNLKMIQ